MFGFPLVFLSDALKFNLIGDRDMSSRFKLPALGSKRCYSAPSLNAFPGVKTFDYNKLDKVVEIGRGSFAVVFSAIYNSATLGENVVVKKIFDLEDDEKDLFLKEVKLLNTLKHASEHRDISWNEHFSSSHNVGQVHVFRFQSL